MNLRAWPGATCVVRPFTANRLDRQLAGRTVTVTRTAMNAAGDTCWQYEGAHIELRNSLGSVFAECIPDAWMVPISAPPGTSIDTPTEVTA